LRLCTGFVCQHNKSLQHNPLSRVGGFNLKIKQISTLHARARQRPKHIPRERSQSLDDKNLRRKVFQSVLLSRRQCESGELIGIVRKLCDVTANLKILRGASCPITHR
jgi:hypothetical protein